MNLLKIKSKRGNHHLLPKMLPKIIGMLNQKIKRNIMEML